MHERRKPDRGLFVGIFGLIAAIFIPILQANGVDLNWQASLILYILLTVISVWSLLTHAVPHFGKLSRRLLASTLILLMGGLGVYATVKQHAREHPKQVEIVWKEPMPIEVGTPLSTVQLDARATLEGKEVDGEFVYNPAIGTTLPAGVDTLSVTFTPVDTGIREVTRTVTITVRLQTPTKPYFPPSAASPSPTVTYRGTGAIGLDQNGVATLPIWFVATGKGTLHFRTFAHSFAMHPAPSTPQAIVQSEDNFWADFDAGEKSHGSSLTTSTMPNRPFALDLSLGQAITDRLPDLRQNGGIIYAAIRFRDAGGKLVEQTCLGIDPTTNFAHLCSKHNVP